MKSTKIAALILIVLSLFSLRCEEHSYIEDLGYNLTDKDADKIGYGIIYSTNVETQCKKLTIFVDDVEVGYIDANYDANKHGNLSCEMASFKHAVLKVMVEAGNHTVRVEGDNGCTFEPTTLAIKEAGCTTLNVYSKTEGVL